jgi:hypothetical protein
MKTLFLSNNIITCKCIAGHCVEIYLWKKFNFLFIFQIKNIYWIINYHTKNILIKNKLIYDKLIVLRFSFKKTIDFINMANKFDI